MHKIAAVLNDLECSFACSILSFYVSFISTRCYAMLIKVDRILSHLTSYQSWQTSQRHPQAIPESKLSIIFFYIVVENCEIETFTGPKSTHRMSESGNDPLSPSIKLQILFLCFHSFLIEVVGRSC